MWQDIVLALALVLVIEGIMPALNPAAFRRGLLMVASLNERTLRRFGVFAMLAGAGLVYLLKG